MYSALPPPLCDFPKFGWGEGLKKKQDLEEPLVSVAPPHVSTGGRQSSCGTGVQGESRDSALQQQTLEEAFFGARLCDLHGSASSRWAAVVLLGCKGPKRDPISAGLVHDRKCERRRLYQFVRTLDNGLKRVGI